MDVDYGLVERGRDTGITCTIDRFGNLKSGSKYAIGERFEIFVLRLLCVFFDISHDKCSLQNIDYCLFWRVTVAIDISFFDGRYLIWLLRKKSRRKENEEKCTERDADTRTYTHKRKIKEQ